MAVKQPTNEEGYLRRSGQMAALSTQQVTRAGLNPSYSAAGGSGDTFNPARGVCLHVKNGSGGSINVTVASPRTVHGLAVQSLVVAVPAGGERLIGPFPADVFQDTTGTAAVTYSASASVTVAVLQTVAD
jgi:hypothetical protein